MASYNSGDDNWSEGTGFGTVTTGTGPPDTEIFKDGTGVGAVEPACYCVYYLTRDVCAAIL